MTQGLFFQDTHCACVHTRLHTVELGWEKDLGGKRKTARSWAGLSVK
jgi:hypothetical protein